MSESAASSAGDTASAAGGISETALLPALAKAIAVWFPELGGRALAVAEADPATTRENTPTLPLCMLSLIREDADHGWKASSGEIEIKDDFIVEFWMKPERYKRADGSETPFWSYYDFETMRDRLLGNVVIWEGPGKQRLEYLNMTMEADAYAVILAFRFRSHVFWCPPEPVEDPCIPSTEKDGQPVLIAARLCAPKSLICDPPPEPEEEPCP